MRLELTEEQWERLLPLLPPRNHARGGRPSKDHRLVVEGISWLHRTGSPWRDLPERFGPWQSIATRFYRWSRQGVWQRVLHELQRQADEEGNFDWSRHYVDGSSVRAHQHAAGAKRGSASR